MSAGQAPGAAAHPGTVAAGSTEAGSTEAGGTGAGGTEAGTALAGLPLRVTTLELFFDLVFAFTLTQLTVVLDGGPGAVGRVLLVFGLLWWMYEGYAWLTNARPPVHAAERLLLLVGMAGFLVVGLAIPRGFGADGIALGTGYLVVVVVHAVLYYRVNRNILRIAPFNLASALLVIAAGAAGGAARYPLWAAALAVQLGSPLIVHPRNLFTLHPGHLAERHSSLLIVALGESVAAIGIGAAHAGTTARLAASSVLGLALAAALWWVIFGGADEERTEQVLTAATSERRTALALAALFYGNVPVLLGLVAMAAGVAAAIAADPATLARAATLAAGAALFLAGDAAIRRLLGTGSTRLRLAAAAAALATTAAGATAGLDAQLALLTAILAGMIVAEQRWDAARGDPAPDTSGGAAAGQHDTGES